MFYVFVKFLFTDIKLIVLYYLQFANNVLFSFTHGFLYDSLTHHKRRHIQYITIAYSMQTADLYWSIIIISYQMNKMHANWKNFVAAIKIEHYITLTYEFILFNLSCEPLKQQNLVIISKKDERAEVSSKMLILCVFKTEKKKIEMIL